MSGSLNKVALIGNLGRDPEIRTLNSGDRIANLQIATSESWKDRATGERKEKTEWHRVVIFNENLTKVAEQYLKKGSKVYLEGALRTRKWVDDSNTERYSTEVVLQAFDSKLVLLGDSAGGRNNPPPADSQDDYGQVKSAAAPSRDFDLDNEIPF